MLVHKVMTLGQEIPDERALRKRKQFLRPRTCLRRAAGLRHKRASEENSFPRSRIANVLHQSKIVELPLHPPPELGSFPDIERLKLRPPSAPEYIDPGRVRNFLNVNEIDKILFRTIPELKRPVPVDMQLHFDGLLRTL